jgi:hypothetical protein
MSVATLIGYLGSALVVASLSMRSILKLRIIGLAGAFTFVAYGYLIDAWPIVLTNVVIVGIQLAFLREILTAEEYFRLLEVRPDSPYLDVFLDRYGSEIAKIWPDFSQEEASGRLTIFVLRDLVPAGLFVANVKRPSVLELRVDFVIPGYRDFKIGRHLYHSGSLLERGFTRPPYRRAPGLLTTCDEWASESRLRIRAERRSRWTSSPAADGKINGDS